MKKNILITLHFLIMILAYISWLFIHWEIISVLALFHIAFLETCNGCVLSHAQFKDKDKNNTAFYEWLLGCLGIKNYDRKKLKIFMRYYLPIIIVLLGIIAQEILNIPPIL